MRSLVLTAGARPSPADRWPARPPAGAVLSTSWTLTYGPSLADVAAGNLQVGNPQAGNLAMSCPARVWRTRLGVEPGTRPSRRTDCPATAVTMARRSSNLGCAMLRGGGSIVVAETVPDVNAMLRPRPVAAIAGRDVASATHRGGVCVPPSQFPAASGPQRLTA